MSFACCQVCTTVGQCCPCSCQLPSLCLLALQDEFLVLPLQLNLSSAFKPGGCMHGYHQVRVVRHNAFFGVTAAEAAACHKAVKAPAAQKPADTNNVSTVAAAKAASDRVLINITSNVCTANNSSSGYTPAGPAIEAAVAVIAAAAAADSGQVNSVCQLLQQLLHPDIQGLANLGWQQYFQLQSVRQRPWQQQQIVGYIDRYTTTAPSVRWAHKSIADPNYVAGYAVHEASVVLLGGRDTGNVVPYTCAFAIHLVNMFRHRWLGSGQQMQLSLGTTGVFNMTGHIQMLVQQQAATVSRGLWGRG